MLAHPTRVRCLSCPLTDPPLCAALQLPQKWRGNVKRRMSITLVTAGQPGLNLCYPVKNMNIITKWQEILKIFMSTILYGFVYVNPYLAEFTVQSIEKLVAVIRAHSRCFTTLGDDWKRWFVPATHILSCHSRKSTESVNNGSVLLTLNQFAPYLANWSISIQPSLIWLFTPGLLRWHVEMYDVKKAVPAVPAVPGPRVPTRRERHEMAHKPRGCSYDRKACQR